MTIYQAPFQGITDWIYRNLHNELFGGVDKYFTPYVKLENSGEVKKSSVKDVSAINQSVSLVVPQVLCNTAEELLFWIDYFVKEGYEEFNLNLGCPYPMVTNRKKGAGLLIEQKMLNDLFSVLTNEDRLRMSVKMRLGLRGASEWHDVISIINEANLKEVIVHSRIAKQLYKGDLHLNELEQIAEMLVHPLVVNGDIYETNDVDKYKSLVTVIDGFMLGRGMLKDPFLPNKIKGQDICSEQLVRGVFEFQDRLKTSYLKEGFEEQHVLNRLKSHWGYWSLNYGESMRVFKLIKKCKSLDQYENKVLSVINMEI